jgi:protein-S-isoprenylcysteine O-methyltransferase Ste14
VDAKRSRLVSPTYFYSLILLAIVLDFVFPIRMVLIFPFTLIGLAPVIVGLFLNVQAIGTLRRNRTTDNFSEAPRVLVTEGVFQYSRNPMYLGAIVFAFGLAILLGSLVNFVFPPVGFLLLHFLYIPDEEDRVKTMFGKEYVDYMKRVRKWI